MILAGEMKIKTEPSMTASVGHRKATTQMHIFYFLVARLKNDYIVCCAHEGHVTFAPQDFL